MEVNAEIHGTFGGVQDPLWEMVELDHDRGSKSFVLELGSDTENAFSEILVSEMETASKGYGALFQMRLCTYSCGELIRETTYHKTTLVSIELDGIIRARFSYGHATYKLFRNGKEI